MGAVAAVDCGATSVRVCTVDLESPATTLEVVHRVAHHPIRDTAGHLRWDWKTITTAVTDGLMLAQRNGPLDAIGIDTWAVDYGLLTEHGTLLGDPYSYRDGRTDHYQRVVEDVGAERMYELNGLQVLPFNTIFQLAVHDPAEMEQAARLLFLPELLIYHLTGQIVVERTSAGSSGLVDISTGGWSAELIAAAGVNEELLGPIESAGQVVGEWRGVPVALVGGHDTASAVAGMGPASAQAAAFVASGTWMLAGIERDTPDTSSWARQHNFTNETGVDGGIRFLRNVTGFWLLEQCRQSWGNPPVADLIRRADRFTTAPTVEVNDPSLLSPVDMLSAYTALAGLGVDADPGLVTASIIDSVAIGAAQVIDELSRVNLFDHVVLFGGAARMGRLHRRLADLIGLPVTTGSTEAAALGNALVQGIAIGVFADLREARQALTTQG